MGVHVRARQARLLVTQQRENAFTQLLSVLLEKLSSTFHGAIPTRALSFHNNNVLGGHVKTRGKSSTLESLQREQ